MGDCPGAGSGDPRDYDHRSFEEQRADSIRKDRAWVSRNGWKFVRLGTPQDGEFFVDYRIITEGNHYYFTSEERKVLKAEYTQLYGSTEMVPLNFDGKYRYYIVEKLS